LKKLAFFLLFFILLVDYFCYGLIVPIVTEKLGIRTGENAVLGSGLVLMLSPTYLVALPILCAISNLWGRKKTLVACFGLSVASYAVFVCGIYIGSAFVVLLSMNLSDITSAELPIAQAIVADTKSPLLKSYFFALLALVDLVDIVSTQLHDYMHQITNVIWFKPMVIALLVVFISLVNFFMAGKFLHATKPVVEDEEQDILTEIIEGFVHILSSKEIRTILIFFAVFALAWGLYFQNIYFFLTDGVVMQSERATLFMIYTCLFMFLTLVVLYPLLIRLLSFKDILFGALILSSIGLAAIAFMTTRDGRWVTGMLVAVSAPLIIPSVWTLLSAKLGRRHQVLVFSIAYLILTLFWEFSGGIVKILNMYSASLALQVSAVLMLCNIPLLLRHRKSSVFASS
jgi:MFS family permease